MSPYLLMCLYELQNAILVTMVYRMYGAPTAITVLIALGEM